MWTGAAGLALACGAMLAVAFVPGARFGVNPTGLFGWHLVWFAALVGVPLAVLQFLLLLRIFPPRGFLRLLAALLWMPVTCGSVVAMLLPMWWWPADTFASMPLSVVMPPLPGAALLGATQALLLRGLAGSQGYWVICTIIGAALGCVVGLMIALITPQVLETVWALVTGLGIGFSQAYALLDVLGRRGREA
jgi:hypothetical protein